MSCYKNNKRIKIGGKAVFARLACLFAHKIN